MCIRDRTNVELKKYVGGRVSVRESERAGTDIYVCIYIYIYRDGGNRKRASKRAKSTVDVCLRGR